jgi:CRISPR-associated protein (TIGR02710 family)
MVKAYDAWDKFDHKEARDILRKIERKDAADNLNFLNELLERKARFRKDLEKNGIKMGEVPTEHIIVDLFSNAKRRAEEGKYDDACARLYRTLEALGQFILLKDYNIVSSDVKLEYLRGKIQEDYTSEYENKRDRKDGKIKLGLVENFDLLKKLNNSVIIVYNEKEEELKAYLNFRNNSILAHGFNPIEEEHYGKLENSIRELISNVINNFDELFHKTKFPTASI